MTKSSKIIIALLVIILIAVLGIGVWLITDKSAGNGSVAITENTAGVANNETVTGNTSVNNNSSNQSQQQNQNTNNSNSNISNALALDLGKQKYEEAINCYDNLEYDISKGSEDEYYEITNINEVKELYTTNAFSKFCTRVGIIEKNGTYYHIPASGETDISYLGYELKVDNISENKITFTVIKKYCANEEDCGLEPEQVQDITTKEETFIIVKENSTWKVDVDIVEY